MRHRFFMLLVRLRVPARVYYPLLDLAYPKSSHRGWRPYDYRSSR